MYVNMYSYYIENQKFLLLVKFSEFNLDYLYLYF